MKTRVRKADAKPGAQSGAENTIPLSFLFFLSSDSSPTFHAAACDHLGRTPTPLGVPDSVSEGIRNPRSPEDTGESQGEKRGCTWPDLEGRPAPCRTGPTAAEVSLLTGLKSSRRRTGGAACPNTGDHSPALHKSGWDKINHYSCPRAAVSKVFVRPLPAGSTPATWKEALIPGLTQPRGRLTLARSESWSMTLGSIYRHHCGHGCAQSVTR